MAVLLGLLWSPCQGKRRWEVYLRQELSGEVQGPPVGSVALLVLPQHVADQAHGLGFLTVQHTCGEDELLGQGHPDGAGQPLRPPCRTEGRNVGNDQTQSGCFNVSFLFIEMRARSLSVKISNWEATSNRIEVLTYSSNHTKAPESPVPRPAPCVGRRLRHVMCFLSHCKH